MKSTCTVECSTVTGLVLMAGLAAVALSVGDCYAAADDSLKSQELDTINSKIKTFEEEVIVLKTTTSLIVLISVFVSVDRLSYSSLYLLLYKILCFHI